MERRKQFLEILSDLTQKECDAIRYAEHLEEFFDHLVPERISSELCRRIAADDWAGAIRECAGYFRHRPDFSLPGHSGKGSCSMSDAENYIHGKVRVVDIDWTFPEDEIDFLFNPTIQNGPRNDEWLWQFNRHGQWGNMARAYTATGEEKYAQVFGKQLLKWIAQTEIPENWNSAGSAWRTIECGIRLLGSWEITFDGFRKSESLSDVTILLMIASMHRQSVHLVEHPTRANWLMMESNGIYTFSMLFPEFSDSADNSRIAADRILAELETQILPDGMHNELSPDYQSVVFGCASGFYRLAKQFGATDRIPEDFVKLIRNTVNAAILLSTPAITQPRTNDTYTIRTTAFTGSAESLFDPCPEYRFFNTQRSEGAPPAGDTASAYLPYAGFAVMRSDWSADGLYLCFDTGPLGVAHQHQDMLNINVFKGSQELIYDDGGGQYDHSDARRYAISAYGHNTALVDGLPQARSAPVMYSEPYDAGWITNDRFDYASAVYSDSFGNDTNRPAVHQREIRFCKPDFFVVSDTLSAADGNLHDYEILFHLDTTKVEILEAYKNGVRSCFDKEYEIVMIPLEDEADRVELITASAVREPLMQGWYNGRNDRDLHEAITVSRKVSGVKDFRFHTLLIPVGGGEDIPAVHRNDDGKVIVCIHGREHTFDLSALNR